jgi:hypothetical protein
MGNVKGYTIFKANGDEVEEPCIVLRGQDVFAVDAAEHYRTLVSRFHPDPSFVSSISQAVENMRRWRVANSASVKIPD